MRRCKRVCLSERIPVTSSGRSRRGATRAGVLISTGSATNTTQRRQWRVFERAGAARPLDFRHDKGRRLNLRGPRACALSSASHGNRAGPASQANDFTYRTAQAAFGARRQRPAAGCWCSRRVFRTPLAQHKRRITNSTRCPQNLSKKNTTVSTLTGCNPHDTPLSAQKDCRSEGLQRAAPFPCAGGPWPEFPSTKLVSVDYLGRLYRKNGRRLA